MGKYVDGYRHGRGILYYKNGDKYEGDFDYDQLNGKGNNIVHTLGIFYYANGDRFEGDFKDDRKHGKGNPFD